MENNFQSNTEVQQAVNDALAVQKKKKRKKVWIILGIIAAIIVIASIVSGSGGSDDDVSNANENTEDSISAEKNESEAGSIGDYVCTISSAETCKNWEGKDSVKITYSFTNNSSDAQSFDLALTDEVYQDGIGLESSFISSDDDWGVDVKIKPGTTKEVSKVYILRDHSTQLEVEISEWISFSDDKLTYHVDLE